MTTLQSLIASVTDEQLSKCHRTIGPDGKTFYQVESENDSTTIYEVRFTARGWSCTCLAGKNAFRDCAYSTCKHCRWTYRSAQLYKAEQAKLAHAARLEDLGLTHDEARAAVNAQLTVNGQPADDETLVRVFGPADRRPSEEAIEAAARRYAASAFQLMR